MLDGCYWLFEGVYGEYGEEVVKKQAEALAKALKLPSVLVLEHFKPICVINVPKSIDQTQIYGSISIKSLDNRPISIPVLSSLTGPKPDFTYITQNRYKISLFPSQNPITCLCPWNSTCSDPRICPCAYYSQSLNSHFYTSKSLFPVSPSDIRVYECGYGCMCNREKCRLTLLSDCSYRLIGRRLGVKFDGQEWGLGTLDGIENGGFVMEMNGIVENCANYYEENLTVLMGIGRNSCVLNMKEMSNLGRFVKRGGKGNCVLVKVWTEHRDPRVSRLVLFACEDVKAGDALSIEN